jgi:hypothetical protein
LIGHLYHLYCNVALLRYRRCRSGATVVEEIASNFL